MTLNVKNFCRITLYASLVFVSSGVFCFCLYAEPITVKACKVVTAYRDIFCPVSFDQVKDFLFWQAWRRVETSHPRGMVELVEVTADGESCFKVRYILQNVDGTSSELCQFVRINWKPFCYD